MTLPSYDELLDRDGQPSGSSWGLWGAGDVFGCLNLLTPERTKRGATCVRKGSVFALNLDMSLPDPPMFGRAAYEHEVVWLQNEAGHDEHISGWNTQSSSQWDGFRHIKHPVHGFYNGIADEDHGMHHWARRGIAGRGVLADVARWRESEGRPLQANASDPIEADDIRGTLAAQGTNVEEGDVLLVRTGWLSWYRSLDEAGRVAYNESGHPCVGLRPGEDNWRLLWDLHIAAIGADNPPVEVWPPAAFAAPEQLQELLATPERLDEIFMHIRLLPLLGLPLGEFFDLDALAEDCAADGVYEFFFTSAPLNLPAGVASPPNALAIK
ncbi:MAG TPA: cyclase family protein [Actinomycetota bacterium]|nr:cyclase family protein [Actinomycetota bacterium]